MMCSVVIDFCDVVMTQCRDANSADRIRMTAGLAKCAIDHPAVGHALYL